MISKAEDFNYEPFDPAICFLTLMFISLEEREALLYELDSKRRLGDGIIVVDKFEPEGGHLLACPGKSGPIRVRDFSLL